MSSSNCCFLTCIQVSQEAGQVVWYSHLFQGFPQFVVIHTIKAFGIVTKAEIDVFLELSCFFDDPADVGNLIPGPTRLRLEFPSETGLILRCAGKVGTPCRQSRGIDPPVSIRRGEGAQMR